jgi:TatD DNase family protein
LRVFYVNSLISRLKKNVDFLEKQVLHTAFINSSTANGNAMDIENRALPPGGADSHAHLDLKYNADELPLLIDRAVKAGVTRIGQVFLGPQHYVAGIERLGAWPQLFFLLGIHPHEASECTRAALEAMRAAFVADKRLKAVGEIGLDFFRNNSPQAAQEQTFRDQLSLAKSLDLPVAIHSRNAARQCIAILEQEGFISRPVLWHCYGDKDALPLTDRLLSNGWHISIPGPITYPGNNDMREAVAQIPPDRLLFETDCPYLSPQPQRGKRNEPSFMTATARCVAGCLEMDAEKLWILSGETTSRFFGLNLVGDPPPDPRQGV